MKRRTFMKLLSTGALSGALLDPDSLLSAAESRSLLAVAKGDDPAALVREALRLLGGMGKFISRGDVVVVKPNMAWDRTPEQAANTNPILVAELVRMAQEAGAGKVKVFDNPCNAPRRVYERSGIAQQARAAGAEVSFTEERKFKKVDIGGEVLDEWPVYKEALEADKIINVPIAKHHSLARYTLSMKNLMGIIGGKRNLLHQKIDINVADLARFFKPTLVVLDGFRILTRNGPQGGSVEDVRFAGVVAASTDQVAVDSFGVTLFGENISPPGYIIEAHKRGLGEMDLRKVRVLEKIL